VRGALKASRFARGREVDGASSVRRVGSGSGKVAGTSRGSAALGSGARPTATRPVVKEKTTDAVVNTMSLLRR
jgi:hypothetical protein